VKLEHLEHVLRAAASITGVSDLVVVGSQAILGTYPEWELPSEATMSIEADLAIDIQLARLDEGSDESALADLIDGAIGEGSMFQQTHGYYAQGVETSTAVLGVGWRDRLVPFICESAEPKVVGWCLERHDLWVSKAAAGREKDREFCRALSINDLVDPTTCAERIACLPVLDQVRARNVEAYSFSKRL
jgi:hypothetical protein